MQRKSILLVVTAVTWMAGNGHAEALNIDARADALLRAMSQKLAAAKQIRLSLRRTTDAGLAEHSDKAVTVEGTVLVKRPNRLAASITTPEHRRQLIYDGGHVFVIDAEANRWAVVEAKRTLDATLEMLEADYDYAPPLADFLFSDPHKHLRQSLKAIGRELESGRHAGTDNVNGSPAHHLAFRETHIDWDLWINARTSLPSRLVITAKGIEGHPKLQLDFLKIALDDPIDDDAFRFETPQGAVKIDMPKIRDMAAAEVDEQKRQSITPPKMKMTTPIPAEITIPDEVKTRLGTLRFFDGCPDEATIDKLYGNLDFVRGVQAYLTSIPAASMHAIKKGLLEHGIDNQTLFVWETMMDSKTLFLTPNTESVYAMTWLDLKDGPLVMETPPNVLGFINDHWFHYVADFGNAGPDKGKGGKFLLLPPGYKGDVPSGYFVCRAATFGNWVALRGFQVDGDPKPAVKTFKRTWRVYPLARAKNPPKMKFVNKSGVFMNTVSPTGFGAFEDMAELVQEEPNTAVDPETLGLLASIGIQKGTRFAPDARMKKILSEAAVVGNATARAIVFKGRDPVALYARAIAH